MARSSARNDRKQTLSSPWTLPVRSHKHHPIWEVSWRRERGRERGKRREGVTGVKAKWQIGMCLRVGLLMSASVFERLSKWWYVANVWQLADDSVPFLLR